MLSVAAPVSESRSQAANGDLSQDDIHKMMSINLELLQQDGGIDMETPAKVFDGNERLFYNMLARIEHMSLIPGIKEISQIFSDGDTKYMCIKTQSFRAACQYIGAYRIMYCCSFMMLTC
jgi:hypothetical protein